MLKPKSTNLTKEEIVNLIKCTIQLMGNTTTANEIYKLQLELESQIKKYAVEHPKLSDTINREIYNIEVISKHAQNKAVGDELYFKSMAKNANLSYNTILGVFELPH